VSSLRVCQSNRSSGDDVRASRARSASSPSAVIRHRNRDRGIRHVLWASWTLRACAAGSSWPACETDRHLADERSAGLSAIVHEDLDPADGSLERSRACDAITPLSNEPLDRWRPNVESSRRAAGVAARPEAPSASAKTARGAATVPRDRPHGRSPTRRAASRIDAEARSAPPPMSPVASEGPARPIRDRDEPGPSRWTTAFRPVERRARGCLIGPSNRLGLMAASNASDRQWP
jgi:hypothetical protein